MLGHRLGCPRAQTERHLALEPGPGPPVERLGVHSAVVIERPAHRGLHVDGRQVIERGPEDRARHLAAADVSVSPLVLRPQEAAVDVDECPVEVEEGDGPRHARGA